MCFDSFCCLNRNNSISRVTTNNNLMMKHLIIQMSASGFKELVGTDGVVSPALQVKLLSKLVVITIKSIRNETKK